MIAEKLKKSILQAAIQGKLTEQLPEDGDARDLLKEIQKEKARLIKEGKIKKEKPFPEISEEEIPFDIPENWGWVRLGELTEVISKGTTPSGGKNSYIGSGIGFVRAENVGADGKVKTDNLMYIDERTHNTILKRSILSDKDLLICIAGTLGRTAVVEANQLPLNSNQAVCFVRLLNREKILVHYLQKVLSSFPIQQFLLQQTKVTAIPNLTLEIISKCIIPLPPISEQHRIVDRLFEIFPEIDKLKNDETKLDVLQKSFPKKMKDSVLQYAIQGKLTEQLPEDGNAKDLLKDIQKEKSRLIKEGKIKKEKPLLEISEDEIPFDIPDNWCWVRLSSIGEIVGGGTPRTEDKSFWHNGNIPWLTPADMKNVNGKYVDRGERCITENGLKNSSAQLMPKGTVLFSSRAPIGYIAIANNPVATNQGFKSIVPFINGLSDYLYYYLMAITSKIEKLGSGTTFKEVSGSVMKELLIPVPPLTEQNRIVHHLEEILPLCETLE